MDQAIVRRLWYRLRRELGLGPLLLAWHPRSILRVSGWNRSFHTGRAVDQNGNAIPWCTYAFIKFIEERLHPGLRVFEYGCGASTLYYAQRVGEVVAVESDKIWAERTSAQAPANCKVIYRNTVDEYTAEILSHGSFDIVIVDGRWRVKCAQMAVQTLNPMGVIVWDNSDRGDFQEGYASLREAGFRALPFWGLLPISFVPAQTTVLYRCKNCLGI